MTPIAFFRTESDDRVMPTPFARSLWAPGTLNGPAVCALAAHRVETAFAEPGFRPARFTIDLFRAAREVPTITRGRLIRSGGRIRVAELDVVQFFDNPGTGDDGVVVARSTTVFLRESHNPPGDRWERQPDTITFVPPEADAARDAALDSDDPQAFTTLWSHDAPDGTVGRWDTEMSRHQNGARKRRWSRAAPAVLGEPITPFARAVTAAESTSLMANWGSTGIGFINCDLTVALSRLPEGQWIGVEADSHTEHDGISASTAGLYDSKGMWGTGMVTAVNNSAAEIDFTSHDLHARFVTE
ncbi:MULTISPECIES: acyl-CoA thioesterase domain-containing protein [unclassified Gordonia (in: high G+C Gram-positive bacteria)]